MLMNLGDPELELIDPTPNVHSLFLHFDKLFFWAKLASRAVVRWSKRMYSCAGICSYDRGGLCDIALSEPLLKLRPRKDLVETLLHEMIHAYLFITCRDQDRDGHGPNFKAHMYRINQAAGLNISIYHDFHDEVQLYQNHWWRCDGPCQTRKPHFGIVRRSMNKAPGPSDYWWESHKRNCGGTFVKIKEPEKPKKPEKKKASSKPTADITKYINKNNDKENNKVTKPIPKQSDMPVKSNVVTKSNSNSTIVVSKKNNIIFNPQVVNSPAKKPIVFSGKGQTISGRQRTSSDGVVETVRNIWANKQLPTKPTELKNQKKDSKINNVTSTNSNKHKADDTHILSPPPKMKKIDDYFKNNATSVLKDLYGQDFVIKENTGNKRLSVEPVSVDMVDCPVCSSKISNTEINRHLDECLNKEVIENICKDSGEAKPVISTQINPEKVHNELDSKQKDKNNDNNIKIDIKNDPLPKIKTEFISTIDLTNINSFSTVVNKAIEIKVEKDINANLFDAPNLSKDTEFDKLIKPKEEKIDSDLKTSPILISKIPKIKIEPSTSKEADGQKCPCCGEVVIKIDEHLDECLAFFDNNATIPSEGASTSFANETIVIDDDDDDLDETLTFNATGTKSPCPCCLKMIEQAEMNDHLDLCLS